MLGEKHEDRIYEQVDLSLGQVGWYAIPGTQNRAGWKSTEVNRKLIQYRLIPETPAVYLVRDPRDHGPGLATIGARDMSSQSR